MTPDYALVLTEHYTGRSFAIEETYESIEALDGGDVPPQSALDDLWPQVQYDRDYAQARNERHAAYSQPDGADALFLQWQRGEATEQDWLDAVQAVKDAHPYPQATSGPISEQGVKATVGGIYFTNPAKLAVIPL